MMLDEETFYNYFKSSEYTTLPGNHKVSFHISSALAFVEIIFRVI